MAATAALLATACRERPVHTEVQGAAATTEHAVRVVRPAAPGSFVDLVSKLEPSVVHLQAADDVSGGPAAVIPNAGAAGLPEAATALGTGFVLDTEGHILTNHHVLGNATSVTVVMSSGESHTATIVGRDPKLDLALVKIPSLPSLRPVRLGDSEGLRRGDWVAVLGNPFGSEVTVSAGVISSLGHLSHEAFVQPSELNYLGFIQTDARVDATNSGGPIVNMAGEVVAIATAPRELGGEVGYAIPISRARAVISQLEKSGVVTRSYVGMYVDQVSPADAERLGLSKPAGALVTDVLDGGPADHAGLIPGDVVLSVNGKGVTAASLPWIVASTAPDTKLTVGVWRNGGAVTIYVVTAEMN